VAIDAGILSVVDVDMGVSLRTLGVLTLEDFAAFLASDDDVGIASLGYTGDQLAELEERVAAAVAARDVKPKKAKAKAADIPAPTEEPASVE
jgi:uncharacterized protein